MVKMKDMKKSYTVMGKSNTYFFYDFGGAHRREINLKNKCFGCRIQMIDCSQK